MTKRKYEGPKCGAKNRQGSPCRRPAGWGTPHPGQGRCKLHGGSTQTQYKHGRYSKIDHPKLKELLSRFEDDDSPLDLLPEVKLLRAILVDYLERYQDFVDAMHAWHATFTTSYKEAYGEWREKVISLTEDEGWRDTLPEDIPTAPDPLDYVDKPRQVLDISAAASLVDKVGAMVDRIERHKKEGSISLETLDRVLEQVGVELVQTLHEEVKDAATRSRILATFERRWGDVRIAPNAGASPRTARRDLN